jgi:hypothetical protein
MSSNLLSLAGWTFLPNVSSSLRHEATYKSLLTDLLSLLQDGSKASGTVSRFVRVNQSPSPDPQRTSSTDGAFTS